MAGDIGMWVSRFWNLSVHGNDILYQRLRQLFVAVLLGLFAWSTPLSFVVDVKQMHFLRDLLLLLKPGTNAVYSSHTYTCNLLTQSVLTPVQSSSFTAKFVHKAQGTFNSTNFYLIKYSQNHEG